MSRPWLLCIARAFIVCVCFFPIILLGQTAGPHPREVPDHSASSLAPRPVDRVVQLPSDPAEETRLWSAAKVVVVGKLYWLCEPTLGGKAAEAGGRLLDQVAMYSTVEVLKGECGPILPVSHLLSAKGFRGPGGGLDSQVFTLGREFALLLVEERLNKQAAVALFGKETECSTCQWTLFMGWLKCEDGGVLRYAPIGSSEGVYLATRETVSRLRKLARAARNAGDDRAK